MPIAPVRSLSEFGIITDLDPYNLPPNAFSAGVNARFIDGGIQRAPVFRDLDTLAEASPRFLYSKLSAQDSFDTVIIGYLNGKLSTWAGGTETDVSIAAYSTSDSESPYSAVTLGNVLYVNREDRVPWALTSSASDFVALANWDSSWRAHTLRSCGGALVALGVTKSGVSYPTMVKTSEFATFDAVPTTWDETDPSNNATENVLNEMAGPIVDGWPLGNSLFIYGQNEVWQMTPDGSSNVFRYVRRFKDAGLINANCVVDVGSKHYVFGTDDIWVHDGTTKASLVDNRVRNFIFRNIDVSNLHHCFVTHNTALKEIAFCYVSGDSLTGFNQDIAGCNRAAVFSYAQSAAGTWTFYDLPYVNSATSTSIDSALTYAEVTETYESIGGTYLDQQASSRKVAIMVGQTSSVDGLTKALYAHDLEGPGSLVPNAINTAATKEMYLERGGFDLDELGVELRGYKLLNSVYPQARLADGAAPIEFSFGAHDYFNQSPDWSEYQTYDGDEYYKLDYYKAGRYLAMRLRQTDNAYVNISGLDFEIDLLGDR